VAPPLWHTSTFDKSSVPVPGAVSKHGCGLYHTHTLAAYLPSPSATHRRPDGTLPDGTLTDAGARRGHAGLVSQTGGSERDALVAQTLPYLLVRALSTGRAADVKRVHGLRACLPLFDFDDDSIVSLKRLLLRCAFAPAFLKCAEGRRFLSSLLVLTPGLTREVMAIVLNQVHPLAHRTSCIVHRSIMRRTFPQHASCVMQVPGGRASVLQAYGEVLFRAWRTAAGPSVAEIEYGCVAEGPLG
jgi:hypothetical protein